MDGEWSEGLLCNKFAKPLSSVLVFTDFLVV